MKTRTEKINEERQIDNSTYFGSGLYCPGCSWDFGVLYFCEWYMMTSFLLAAAILLGGLPILSGPVSQYAESPTAGTLQYRQEAGQIPYDLPTNIVLFAVVDCDQIGREGLISIAGGEWEPLIVFDCSGHASTTSWLTDNGIMGEIGYYTAARHNVICLCGVDARLVWLN